MIKVYISTNVNSSLLIRLVFTLANPKSLYLRLKKVNLLVESLSF